MNSISIVVSRDKTQVFTSSKKLREKKKTEEKKIEGKKKNKNL